jgi:hypothetical protein
MTINPPTLWASSYDKKWQEVFDGAKEEGFNIKKATADAWADWNDSNANKIGCIAPIASAIPLTGTTNPKMFAPVDFSSAKTPAQSADVLAKAWQSWASAITWLPVPPAPPFSAITVVHMDSGSVAGAYANLLSGLIAEFAAMPQGEGGVKAKYTAIGNLFRTAATSLKVEFIGMSMSSPPAPLKISVPVF